MKKIYKKPIITVESFVTEEIMESEQNELSSPGTAYYNDATFGYINFATGDANVLTSIRYDEFAN